MDFGTWTSIDMASRLSKFDGVMRQRKSGARSAVLVLRVRDGSSKYYFHGYHSTIPSFADEGRHF